MTVHLKLYKLRHHFVSITLTYKYIFDNELYCRYPKEYPEEQSGS